MSSHITYRLSYIVKDLLLSLLSAFLLIISFPGFNIWLSAWIAFLPLFLALRGKSRFQAFLLAYMTGIIFWSGNIYWLVHVTLPGQIILVLYLASYFGFFGLLSSRSLSGLSLKRILLIPSLWVGLEYIRGYLFTGFPWSLLGYSQQVNLPVIQLSDLTGAWGVSFLVILVNIGIFRAFTEKHKLTELIRRNWLPLLSIVAVLLYGCYRLYWVSPDADSPTFKVSVIQGNIPQELKWRNDAKGYIFNKYLSLSLYAAREHPDLIVWPEAALPVVLEEEPEYIAEVQQLAIQIQTPILLGALTNRDGFYYNSAVLVSSQGEIVTVYDKLHLVPFGEYVPLKGVFKFLENIALIGDMQKGREYTVFQEEKEEILLSEAGSPQKFDFSVLICFEDLFPELSRRFVRKGAGFLVNITNDAWYKHTSASAQHLQASVFRAVENNIILVRSANTGISGFISPRGRILSLVKGRSGEQIFIEGQETSEIFLRSGRETFYTGHGDKFILLVYLYIFAYFLLWIFKRRQAD